MWKNKHLVVALLVAPMLAIMAWFAVDYFVAERPQAAQPGAMYPLLAKSNCRYASGQCDLDNEDFEMTLSSRTREQGGIELVLNSRFALDGVRVQVGAADAQVGDGMAAADEAGVTWTLPLAAFPEAGTPIRVAAVRNESTYYAEITAIFLHGGPAGL